MVRAHESSFSNERYDYVAMKDNAIGQALSFLEIKLYRSDKIIQLCIVKTFTPTSLRHASELQTLKLDDDCKFVPLDSIVRPIHIVPGFSSMYTGADGSNLYHQYLLNHDVSRYEWSLAQDRLLHIKEKDRVRWESESSSGTTAISRSPPVYKQEINTGESSSNNITMKKMMTIHHMKSGIVCY